MKWHRRRPHQPIHRIRGRIEKIFGTRKRSYGLRRILRIVIESASDPKFEADPGSMFRAD